jgi:DNA-binding MarR family transcriptional regulator
VTAPSDRDPVIDSLVQTSFTVLALLNQVAAAHDLSLTQLRVLAILRDHQPKIAELAEHLGLERSSVSGLIDRAVKRGLVRRAPGSDDGRVVQVLCTEAGRELADVVGAEIAGLLAPLSHRLNSGERKRLDTLLVKFLRR